MTGSSSSAGQRLAIIRHAYLLHHAQRITALELARVIREFRR